jgi:hypothetical protein
VANATLFYFLFHRLVSRREHFTFINFAWGLHGGVDVKYIVWRLACSWSCANVIVIRVKVRGGIVPFSLMAIDSTDTSRPPNGEIYKDKSHLLLNNPARTSVSIETAEKYLR